MLRERETVDLTTVGDDTRMDNLPPGLKQLFSFSKGEMTKLRQDYHFFLGMTAVTVISAFTTLTVSILMAMQDVGSVIFRVLLLLAAGLNVAVAAFLYNESMKRRQYLIQVEQMIKRGATFLESIRSLFRNQ